MITYELAVPHTKSIEQLLQVLPDEALLSADLAAAVLKTSAAALEKARYVGKGVPFVCLDRRRVRYRVKDLKRWLAKSAPTARVAKVEG